MTITEPAGSIDTQPPGLAELKRRTRAAWACSSNPSLYDRGEPPEYLIVLGRKGGARCEASSDTNPV